MGPSQLIIKRSLIKKTDLIKTRAQPIHLFFFLSKKPSLQKNLFQKKTIPHNRMGASMPKRLRHVRMHTALASHSKTRSSSQSLPSTRQSLVKHVMHPANVYKYAHKWCGINVEQYNSITSVIRKNQKMCFCFLEHMTYVHMNQNHHFLWFLEQGTYG